MILTAIPKGVVHYPSDLLYLKVARNILIIIPKGVDQATTFNSKAVSELNDFSKIPKWGLNKERQTNVSNK
jgi:hypothetical protein